MGASPSTWICAACRAQASRRAVLNSPETTALRRQFSSTVRRPASSNALASRAPIVPDAPARTRFAPSPTGYLHIGGLRTALFSHLLAKRTGGQFILRIEDTDQKRLVRDAEQRLFEDLDWAGLEWDEGPRIGGPYGPYRQSERSTIYLEHARKLLDAESAYRCFCTPQSAAEKQVAYVTSGCYQDCASLPLEQAEERAVSEKQPYTVRLRQPWPLRQSVPDLVHGKIKRLKRSPAAPQSANEDSGLDAADTVLVKSDGTPTYHFANVVDDHLMKVTHVIRGSEWMASTPLHFDIYRAFDWQPPAFAHVGLLVDEQGAKLSKRSGAVALDVRSMRKDHDVQPEALSNFLTLLGWSNPTKDDVMDFEDLVRNFDLKFTRGNTMVKMEKLRYLQRHHVARRCDHARQQKSFKPVDDLVSKIAATACHECPTKSINTDLALDGQSSVEAFCAAILLSDDSRYEDPQQYIQRNKYFFVHDSTYDGVQEFFNPPKNLKRAHMARFAEMVLNEGPWHDDTLAEMHRSPNSQFISSYIEIAESIIHTRLTRSAWRFALDVDAYPQLLDPPEIAPVPPQGTLKTLDEMLPAEVSDASRNPDLANILFANARQEEISVLLKRVKVLNNAIMRYLRQVLCQGSPGPSVSVVMAILGHEECRKRLNSSANKHGEREDAQLM